MFTGNAKYQAADFRCPKNKTLVLARFLASWLQIPNNFSRGEKGFFCLYDEQQPAGVAFSKPG